MTSLNQKLLPNFISFPSNLLNSPQDTEFNYQTSSRRQTDTIPKPFDVEPMTFHPSNAKTTIPTKTLRKRKKSAGKPMTVIARSKWRCSWRNNGQRWGGSARHWRRWRWRPRQRELQLQGTGVQGRKWWNWWRRWRLLWGTANITDTTLRETSIAPETWIVTWWPVTRIISRLHYMSVKKAARRQWNTARSIPKANTKYLGHQWRKGRASKETDIYQQEARHLLHRFRPGFAQQVVTVSYRLSGWRALRVTPECEDSRSLEGALGFEGSNWLGLWRRNLWTF